MALFKKKLLEKAIVYDIVVSTFRQEMNEWEATYRSLREQCATGLGREFAIPEEIAHPWFDLTLAKIAISLRQISNLYPANQAARLREHIFRCVCDLYKADEQSAELARGEILAYENALNGYATDREAPHGSPTQSVAARLLHNWLGPDLGPWDVEIEGSKTGVVSPLSVILVEGFIVPYARVWKEVKDKFQLVQE